MTLNFCLSTKPTFLAILDIFLPKPHFFFAFKKQFFFNFPYNK